MQVLAILARKGGVGKSLLARALAVQALTQGKRAAILDADPQGTVLAWRARRPHPAPHVVGLGNRAMADVLREIKSGGGDIALIDTPPHAQPIISKAAELNRVQFGTEGRTLGCAPSYSHGANFPR
jgi:chromosome partitioning protein